MWLKFYTVEVHKFVMGSWHPYFDIVYYMHFSFMTFQYKYLYNYNNALWTCLQLICL